MAKINFANLSFNPTPGSVKTLLRMFAAGLAPTDAAEIYNAPSVDVGLDGVVDAVEIAGLGGANADGNFDLYLTAVDANGNESDFAIKVNVPLDLVAPQPPTWN